MVPLITLQHSGGCEGETVEKTIVRPVDWVPPEQGAVWLPECNIVLVSRQLCDEERDRAIADLAVRWRRSMLRLVV